MATVQWLGNDPLSVYDSNTGEVFTGYKNLQLPSWTSDFRDLMESFGKSLVSSRKDILTPYDIVRIKNRSSGVPKKQYVPLERRSGQTAYEELPSNLDIREFPSSEVITTYAKVFSALQDESRFHEWAAAHSPVLRFVSFEWQYYRSDKPFSLQRLNVQKLILEYANGYIDERVKSFDRVFLSNLQSFLTDILFGRKSKNRPLWQRYKTSRMAGSGVLQPVRQNITALMGPDFAAVDPDVFSRLSDGFRADPVVDFLASAFCRVIQSPTSQTPEGTIHASQSDVIRIGDWAGFDAMVARGLSRYYPRLNGNGVPDGASLEKMSTLYIVRSLCMNVDFRHSFGTSFALREAYKSGNSSIQEAIVSAFYPFGSTSSFNVRSYHRVNSPNNRNVSASAKNIVSTILLMDYLNIQDALYSNPFVIHTVNYMTWIKVKCEEALRIYDTRSDTPQFFNAFDLDRNSVGFEIDRIRGESLIDNVARAGVGLGLDSLIGDIGSESQEEPTEMVEPVFIPGQGYYGGGQGAQEEPDESSQEEPDESSQEEPDESSQEEPLELETSKQTTESASGINPVIIYAGSALILSGALGYLIYSKRKSSNSI